MIKYITFYLFIFLTLLQPVFCVASESSSSPSYQTGIINFADGNAGLEGVDVVGTELIQFWNEVEPQEGVYDWSQVDSRLEKWGAQGKKVDIRMATVHNQPFNTPRWLYEKYNVRMVARGYWADFEKTSSYYKLFPVSERTSQSQYVLNGEWSIHARTSEAANILQLNPEIRLDSGAEYCVQFDYKLFKGGCAWVAAIADNGKSSASQKVIFSNLDGKNEGNSVVFFNLDSSEDCQIVWGCDSAGEISLDNINIMKIDLKPAWKKQNFDSENCFLKPVDGVLLEEPQGKTVNGSRCIYAKNDTHSPKVILTNIPERWSLEKYKGYVIKTNVKAFQDTTLLMRFFRPNVPFDLDFEGGVPVYKKKVLLKAGTSESINHYMTKLLDADDYVFQIRMEGKGEIALDDMMVRSWSDRVVGFPDYFNPVFKSKWQKFVKELGSRYNGHPDVGVISVGGFGRWEEVMLDEDHHGILDDQWLALGFSQQRYLKHIEWTMDLYKRCFPNKDLRICLAYGLQEVNDVDWIYRRTAQAAAKRGIGIKQNGLSERYNSWNDNTNASYLFSYYRNNPDVRLTFETGGQIYRDVNLVMGYPVSLINRALIDGADNLFLYGSDIDTRNVRKYLHYATEQMGSQLFTVFYNKLGDYSMMNEHSPNPVDYHNIWLGLRQLPSPNNHYTDVDGQKCARLDQVPLIFDMDDRWQYAGMFTPVLGVEYYDAGTDSFNLRCLNQKNEQEQVLGTVRKHNTLQWKWFYCYNPSWSDSKRQSLRDIQNDIVIDSNDDGVDLIKSMEMSFVPAQEWKTKTVKVAGPTSDYVPLKSTLSCDISLQGDPVVNFISISVWSDWRDDAFAIGKVFQKKNSSFELESEKQMYLPADKDWILFPIPSDCTGDYRVELSEPRGSIGWYKSQDGGFAYQCLQYEKTSMEAKTSKRLAKDDGSRINFTATKPFCGIQLQKLDTKSDMSNVEVIRQMPNGQTFSFPVKKVVSQPAGLDLCLEPMPAGKYQINFGTQFHSVAPVIYVHYLNRIRNAKKPSFSSPCERIKEWHFTGSLEGWHTEGKCQVFTEEAGFRINLESTEPRIISPPFTLKTEKNQVLCFSMLNETASSLVRVWWADETGSFSMQRSVYIPVVPNDSFLREYRYPVGIEPEWAGTITKLKIQPVTGMTDAGQVILSQIALNKEDVQ